MDLRRLREETRTEHESTEAVLPLASAELTLETYKAALCAMLPVIEGWETWAAAHAPERVRPLLRERRRSHLLRQDLAHLGVPGCETPTSARVRVDWSRVVAGEAAPGALEGGTLEAGFFGAWYVMEGSTLGGRFIARAVEAAFGLEPGRGDAYFQGHGERTGALWRETTAAIGAVPEAESEHVIAAAKRAFGAFGDALRAELEPRPGR